MAGEVVKYALTLEGRQFIRELQQAKREAKDAARQIASAGKDASGGSSSKMGDLVKNWDKTTNSIKKAGGTLDGFRKNADNAKNSIMGFSGVASGLARALNGDLVGASRQVAGAIGGIGKAASLGGAAVLGIVAVFGTLFIAVRKAIQVYMEYRKRVEEARKENLEFAKSLAEVADKWQAGRDQSAEEKRIKAGGGESIRTAIENQERKTEYAWDQAIAAARELKEAQSRFRPNSEEVEALKAKRDAAKEEYENQLELLGRYKDMYSEWDEKQKEAIADARKAAEEAAEKLKDANREELDRRKYEAAKDDPSKLMALAAEKNAAAISRWGFGDDYEDRLKRGMATEEEIKARKEIEEMQARILELAKKQTEEAKKQRQEKEREAKDAAKEEQERIQKLSRSREAALVRDEDFEGLQRGADRLRAEADKRFGAWTNRKALTATQEELDMRAEIERIEEEARRASDAVDQRARERARASKDAAWLERQAKELTREADSKWGEWTDAKFRTATDEEWNERQKAAQLMEDAKAIREEGKGKDKDKPWVEGVVAARGMSIGDVFNNMRGMNGAKVHDPNLDAAQSTAKNTNDIKTILQKLNDSMKGGGVQ